MSYSEGTDGATKTSPVVATPSKATIGQCSSAGAQEASTGVVHAGNCTRTSAPLMTVYSKHICPQWMRIWYENNDKNTASALSSAISVCRRQLDAGLVVDIALYSAAIDYLEIGGMVFESYGTISNLAYKEIESAPRWHITKETRMASFLAVKRGLDRPASVYIFSSNIY